MFIKKIHAKPPQNVHGCADFKDVVSDPKGCTLIRHYALIREKHKILDFPSLFFSFSPPLLLMPSNASSDYLSNLGSDDKNIWCENDSSEDCVYFPT